MRMKLSALTGSLLDRRMFGRLLLGAGVCLTTSGSGARRARAHGQPVYYTWEGYDDPSFFVDYVADGRPLPIMQTYTDEVEAFQNLSAGMPADVSFPCADTLPHWREAGLLQPIDVSRLSNWPDVIEPLRHVPGTETDGQQWLAPVEWGTTSVIYRTDLVDIEEESYRLLWDPRYAGKLAFGEDVTESVIMAALAAGIADPFNMSDDELALLKQQLVAQRDLLKYYWTEPAMIEQDLRSGEIVATSGWSETYLSLKSEGVPVKYMNPREGILSWCCGLALMRSATMIDEAYDLIDAMLGVKAGLWLTSLGMVHSNRKVFEAGEHNFLAELGLPTDPTELLAGSVFLRKSPRLFEYQRMFEEVRGAS